MPTGARNVLLCFSAASMKMVKTSMAVKNISMKRPRTTDVSLSVVRTFIEFGKRAETMPEAAMAPTICVMKIRLPRIQPMAPIRHMPKVTCT